MTLTLRHSLLYNYHGGKSNDDRIDVESVKIDDMEHPENRQRAIDYQIMAVPTVVIDGEVSFIGAPSDAELIEKLESLL